MRIYLRSLSRLGLLLAALLTLTLIFSNTHLPITQAENSTNEKAAPAQGYTVMNATLHCDSGNMVIDITTGDAPFDLQGVGPNLPMQLPALGTYTIDGGGISVWSEVSIESGNWITFGEVDCTSPYIPLVVSYECTVQQLLNFDIHSGDGPFTLTYDSYFRTGLMAYTSTAYPVPPIPPVFHQLTFTEETGDHEVINFGDVDCTYPDTLRAITTCNGDYLHIWIYGGNPPFSINGTGPGLPTTVNSNHIDWYSPSSGTWQNMTITELYTDHETLVLPDTTCPSPQYSSLVALAQCVGPNLEIELRYGDGPFDVTGSGPHLPRPSMSAGIFSLNGPNTWTGVTVTEQGGDHQTTLLGDFACEGTPPPPNLAVQTRCISTTLEINISPGDPPFLVQGNGPGLPQVIDSSIWALPLQGPAIWTNLSVTEQGGDFETVSVSDIACGVGQHSLQASASCSGTTLQVDIPVGDGPFYLNNRRGYGFTLYGLGPHLVADYVATYGPMTGLVVSERSGDFEAVTLGDVTCDPVPTVEPPPPPTVEPPPPPTDVPPPPPTDVPPTPPLLPPPPAILPDYVPARVMEISSSQQHMIYDRPGGDPIRNSDNSLLMLPHDSDGSGFDTFIVLDAQIYEGEVWLGIYLGGPDLGWLPQADLYPAVEEE